MRKPIVAATAALTMVLMAASVVGAEDFTGAEEQEETLACRYDRSAYPETQEAPGDGECVDPDTQPTYQGLVWDNEVDCNNNGIDLGPARVYESTTQSGNQLGVCNDDDSGPIQGRAVLQVGDIRNPFIADAPTYAYIDGDESNGQYHDVLTGYGRVDVADDGPAVTCADSGGKQDASSPSTGDGQEACG